MKSTRLPGKVLLPIPFLNGKPIIQWVVDELKLSSFKKEIIVATSVNVENNILTEYCQNNLINCFRGKESDVLSRFISIVRENKYKAVVRLTGDNPIIDIELLDRTIDFHLQNKNDYTQTNDLPLGMNFEVISPYALLDLEKKITSDFDKEHVTSFIKCDNSYKKGIYKIYINEEIKKLRLTIDYPSDFMVLSALLTVAKEKKISGTHLIENVFSFFPWIFDANIGNVQKNNFSSFKQEKIEAIKMLELFDFKQVAALLKSCGAKS